MAFMHQIILTNKKPGNTDKALMVSLVLLSLGSGQMSVPCAHCMSHEMLVKEAVAESCCMWWVYYAVRGQYEVDM